MTRCLQAGANLEARNEYGSTPLHHAVAFEKAEIVTVLLEVGADPNARDNDSKQPFEYARDNEELKETGLYWMLRQAALQ